MGKSVAKPRRAIGISKGTWGKKPLHMTADEKRLAREMENQVCGLWGPGLSFGAGGG